MRQWHFITLHARPMSGRRDGRVRHRDRVLLISALSAMAFMLPTPSALPQASQGKEDASGQQAFNNACRTCHMVREGDNRLGPNLHKVVAGNSMKPYGGLSSSDDRKKIIAFLAQPR